MPMHTTSASLIERLRQPAAHEAWTRFVKLYTPLLYSWAGRLGLSTEDAADLVQEVLTLLVQKLPAFAYDPNLRFRGWLWTLTLNQCRAGQRRKALPLQTDPGRLASVAAADEVEEVDEAEYRHYLVGRVLQLMQSEFHEGTWRAFWESVAEDRPATEVAERLGVSVAAVYAAKSRVLRRLREELHLLLD
jgi:RNA polymerase sigma-70 factor (ECF subfamily)